MLVAVYRKLVDRANDWLDRNRDVQVKTCQTMTWMSHDSSRLGSGEFMISSKNFTENAVTYYLRGLRSVTPTIARVNKSVSK